MARILSIWLPTLPLDRLVRRDDPRTGGPFAIVNEKNNAWRLTCVNDAAAKEGLTPDLSLADARAISPDLLTERADPARESGLLRALWRWSDQLSPSSFIDEPDGLVLDITGCAHLFGGEASMAAHASAELSRLRFQCRLAIADTRGAAWSLARFSPDPISNAPPGQTKDALQHLPVDALKVGSDVKDDLKRLGLTSIGQLYSIKTSELARRFGMELVKALGCALGLEPEPVTPIRAPSIFAARMSLPEPIGLTADVLSVLERLSNSVCSRLRDDGKGALRFRLTIRCVDTGDHDISVGFARPCSATDLLIEQFRHPLENFKIEFGADWLRLVADAVEPLHTQQLTLGERDKAHDATLRMLTTIGNRLGFDRLRMYRPLESHLPEGEFETVEVVDAVDKPVWRKSPRKRPLRIFRPPQRLRILSPGRPPGRIEWRGAIYSTKSAEGPERLTAEWWRPDDERTRDYWTIRTNEGARLWLLNYVGAKTYDWRVAGVF